MSEVWTEARIEQLTKLKADGLSASQIAAELGGVTRNAVIGKCARLGLMGRGQPKTQIKRQRRTHSTARNPVARQTPTNGLHLEPTPIVRVKVYIPEPEALRLTLFELTDSTCKWPVTDEPPHRFCGAGSLAGSRYCEHHTARSIAVQEPRRRRAA